MLWDHAKWVLVRRPRSCPFCEVRMPGRLIRERVANEAPANHARRCPANWEAIEGPQLRYACENDGYGEVEVVEIPPGDMTIKGPVYCPWCLASKTAGALSTPLVYIERLERREDPAGSRDGTTCYRVTDGIARYRLCCNRCGYEELYLERPR